MLKFEGTCLLLRLFLADYFLCFTCVVNTNANTTSMISNTILPYFRINKIKLLKKSLCKESIVSSFKTKAKETMKLKCKKMNSKRPFSLQSYKVLKVD